MVIAMRRVIFLGVVAAGVCLMRLPALAQDMPVTTNAAVATLVSQSAATNAAAVAEAQGFDEKFKQLAADIDSLRAANETIRDKLSALHDEIQQVRTEQARLASNAISADDLKPLAAKIEEVDKKRIADKDEIADQVKQTAVRLGRLITDSSGAAPGKPVSNPPPVNVTATTGQGYNYTVVKGDILPAIVSAYNAKFKEMGMKTIRQKQVEDANPTVNWSRLQVGQVIIIPQPPK
jgi:predicted RNase H-like nuclease (RuvC/YqgF family)